VFAAWLVFGEKATPGFAVAIALVVAGVALVNSRFMGPGDRRRIDSSRGSLSDLRAWGLGVRPDPMAGRLRTRRRKGKEETMSRKLTILAALALGAMAFGAPVAFAQDNPAAGEAAKTDTSRHPHGRFRHHHRGHAHHSHATGHRTQPAPAAEGQEQPK